MEKILFRSYHCVYCKTKVFEETEITRSRGITTVFRRRVPDDLLSVIAPNYERFEGKTLRLISTCCPIIQF